jgi:hypothetical protein
MLLKVRLGANPKSWEGANHRLRCDNVSFLFFVKSSNTLDGHVVRFRRA